MVLYKDFQPCETWKSIVFFFTCVWYRQSAGYASLESDDFSCITTKFTWSPPWDLAIFFWSAPPPPTHSLAVNWQSIFFYIFPIYTPLLPTSDTPSVPLENYVISKILLPSLTNLREKEKEKERRKKQKRKNSRKSWMNKGVSLSEQLIEDTC